MSSFNHELAPFLKRLRPLAMKLARNPEAADDLIQETMVKALAGQHLYTPGTNMGAWLVVIMRNAFLDSKRREARRGQHVLIENKHIDPTAGAQFHAVCLQETLKLMSALPQAQRAALIQAVFGGHEYAQIATRTGVAVGTVKSRVSRARAAMAPSRESDADD